MTILDVTPVTAVFDLAKDAGKVGLAACHAKYRIPADEARDARGFVPGDAFGFVDVVIALSDSLAPAAISLGLVKRTTAKGHLVLWSAAGEGFYQAEAFARAYAELLREYGSHAVVNSSLD